MVDDHVNKGVSVSTAIIVSKFGISISSVYTIIVRKLKAHIYYLTYLFEVDTV